MKGPVAIFLSTNVFLVKLFLFYFVPIPYFLSYTHPYSHTRKKPNTFVLSTNIQTNSFSLVAYAYHRTIRLVKFFSTYKVEWSNFTNCPNFHTRIALLEWFKNEFTLDWFIIDRLLLANTIPLGILDWLNLIQSITEYQGPKFLFEHKCF